MSNYPPGVTGNEYEIAGADAEWIDNDFECSNEEFEFVRISPYALKVIDVLKSPQLAEEDKILATPTLSKILPQSL